MPSADTLSRDGAIAGAVPLTVRRSEPSGFDGAVLRATGSPLAGATLATVQVNIGLRCNLACRHCHVESGPLRAEAMDGETIDVVLAVAAKAGAETIDITGGAPELHPEFRRFVAEARRGGHAVIIRTNLTILLEEGYGDLPEFFRDTGVALVASLPCYLEDNVDRQRGRHVYAESIEVLRRLNALGFGIDAERPLHLVYNPGGASLPPPQASLECDYRRELERRFGLRFTSLFTITNMPIGRFQHDLDRAGKGDAYRALLQDAFNPATVDALMCRHQIHVSHDGSLHDCDFNYAVGMGVADGAPRHVRDLLAPGALDRFRTRRIATAEHCFGCTAGCGSSCGGSLS